MSRLCRPSSDLSVVVLITLSIFSVSKPFLPSSYPLSRIFQRVPTWMALYSLTVLCGYESAHSLTSRWFQVSFSCTPFCHWLRPASLCTCANEWIFFMLTVMWHCLLYDPVLLVEAHLTADHFEPSLSATVFSASNTFPKFIQALRSTDVCCKVPCSN